MTHDGISILREFFRTHAARDEARHFAMLDRNMKYFDSISGIRDSGIANYIGIFRSVAAQHRLGEVTPRRIHGSWPEYIVVADMNYQPPGKELVVLESLWHFVLDESGLIQELGIFWSPTGPVILK